MFGPKVVPGTETEHYARHTHGEIDVSIASCILTREVNGDEWLASHTAHFTPEKRISIPIYWRGDWVGLGAGLDVAAKKESSDCRESNPSRPARSLPNKRKDVPGAWGKFHDEELSKFYSSQNNSIMCHQKEWWWNRVLLKKPVAAQLIKKFPSFL